MAILEIITKEDFEQFKLELFTDLRKPRHQFQKQNMQKEWLKSYEVRELLRISPGTLQNLSNNGILKFNRTGGLIFYKYDDVVTLIDGVK